VLPVIRDATRQVRQLGLSIRPEVIGFRTPGSGWIGLGMAGPQGPDVVRCLRLIEQRRVRADQGELDIAGAEVDPGYAAG
jgi:hypothetical protein